MITLNKTIAQLANHFDHLKNPFDHLQSPLDRKKPRQPGNVFFINSSEPFSEGGSSNFNPSLEQIRKLEKVIKDFYIAFKASIESKTPKTFESANNAHEEVIRMYYEELNLDRQTSMNDCLARLEKFAIEQDGEEGQRVYEKYYALVHRKSKIIAAHDIELQEAVERFYNVSLKYLGDDSKASMLETDKAHERLISTYVALGIDAEPGQQDILRRLEELSKLDGEAGETVLKAYKDGLASSEEILLFELPATALSEMIISSEKDGLIDLAFGLYFGALRNCLYDNSAEAQKELDKARTNLANRYREAGFPFTDLLISDFFSRLRQDENSRSILQASANNVQFIQDDVDKKLFREIFAPE